MYEFRLATQRILDFREQIRNRTLCYDAQRDTILTEAYRANQHIVPIIKRPLGFKTVCENLDLYIGDTEIIVGSKGGHLFSTSVFPDWMPYDWILDFVDTGKWTMHEDGMYHNPGDEELRQSITHENYEALKAIHSYWENNKVTTVADAWKPEFYDELARLNVSSYAEGGMSLAGLPAGHLVCGYKKIINTGFAAIRKESQDFLDAHRGHIMGDDMDKYMFHQSVVITCDGAITLVKRYAQACRDKAEDWPDPMRKAELLKMAESLDWISEKPSRNFREAVQLTMMYQVMIQIESPIPSPALGRFDQYTWPFLKKDLEEGTITMDEAQEICDAFFLKANCYYAAGPAKLVNTSGIGNTYQHTTLGGVDPETGEDATNPVTYMVLETVGRLKLHDPTISLRFNKNSSNRLWDCALATSKLVGGLPLYQNDEVIIPSLMREVGFELKDARDYGIIGCQEIVGCGTDYPAPNGCFPPHAGIWWGSVMNMAINDGGNPLNGEQASLHTGYLYEMNSMEEVREALRKMGHYIFEMFISVNNYAEYITQYYNPQAILSMSIEGCMEKGKDCVNGGAKYNSYGGTATGLATIADSLTTIKYMIFDKKLISAKELLDAVVANWEGCEPLRQRILSEVPHFGNGDPYADEEFKFVADLYYEVCRTCHSKRSTVYKSGLYGASDHVAQGHKTWATPDGRKYPEPLADAASPAQGRDKNGPTAVFASAGCYDHHHYLGGIALNIKIHPSVLANQAGADKLRNVTKTYFDRGGMEVQYNVVNTETLRLAQENPEDYRDLVVRIAGYSAYFVELGRELQNDIISRNENVI
jgi:formate C-acetyltransferase